MLCVQTHNIIKCKFKKYILKVLIVSVVFFENCAKYHILLFALLC